MDNHCHGLLADPAPMSAEQLRLRFSETAFGPFPAEHTTTSVHYLWAIRQLSEKLDCDPTEQAVLEARAARSQDEIDRLFMADANISWLLVDDGYPDPADTVDRDTQARRTGARIGWVERIEVVAGNLVAGHATFAEFDEAMRAHLASYTLASIAEMARGKAAWPEALDFETIVTPA